jgi:hypothetical protein
MINLGRKIILAALATVASFGAAAPAQAYYVVYYYYYYNPTEPVGVSYHCDDGTVFHYQGMITGQTVEEHYPGQIC